MSLQFPNALKEGQCVLVPVDVKQNKNYPPSVHCAPIDARQVLDDRALICRDTTPGGKARMSVRFASELGGPFGAGVTEDYQFWHAITPDSFLSVFKPIGLLLAKIQNPDGFSRYTFEATDDGYIALTTGTDASSLYAVDNNECAKRAMAGAVACWGYGVEDKTLMSFGEEFYNTAMRSEGVALPAQDRIAAQSGETLSKRNDRVDIPRAPLITLAADVVATHSVVPSVADIYNTAIRHHGFYPSVHLDVKANDVMPFNINFAPINSQVVTNDEAELTYRKMSDWVLCARFKSEVDGPLGAVMANHQENFSVYELCINYSNQIYAEKQEGDGWKKFKVDSVERAVFAVASAVGTLAYLSGDFDLKHYADRLYATRAQITTTGEALPRKDQLVNQTKTSRDFAAENFELKMEMRSQHAAACAQSFFSLACLTPVQADD